MKSFIKEMFRDFRHAKGRFIAIVAIVALGAGFFGGLKATSVDMKLTANKYYEESNLMNFRLLSTLGITENDVKAIKEVEGVSEVMPSYRMDAIISKLDSQDGEIASDSIVRLHALSKDSNINKLKIEEGRLPQSPDECVVINSKSIGPAYKLGDKIEIDKINDPDAVDNLNNTVFTIVGKVATPLYMSIEKGNTDKGSGSVNNFAFIPAEAFNMETYTEMYVTMKGTENISCYDDAYTALNDAMEDRLENIGIERNAVRYDEVIGKANKELADAQQEYDEKKADAEIKLADGQKKIDDAQKDIKKGEQDIIKGEKEIADNEIKLADARKEIADGEITLADKQKEFDEKIADAEIKLEEARVEIEDNQKKLDDADQKIRDGESALSKGQEQYNAGKTQLDAQRGGYEQAQAAKPQLEAGIAQAQAALDLLLQGDPANPQIPVLRGTIANLNKQLSAVNAGIAQFEAAQSQLSSAKSSLNSGSEEISKGYRAWLEGTQELKKGRDEFFDAQMEFITQKADGEKQLEDARLEIEDGKVEISDGLQKIAQAKLDIAKGKKDLAEGKTKLADAKIEYADKKAEAEEKLADGQEKLDDARVEVNDIENPEWFVMDRSDVTGYTGFEQDADRVDAVAVVFPIFFFLVAALVCLTTMTRMVEEQRGQIGTMRALGYSKIAIVSKYIIYAIITSLLGSIVGLLIGFQVFPRVIWAAYGIMYTTPPILTPWNTKFAIIVISLFVLCIVGATLMASLGEVMSTPAELIRPKPPKNGKRVFLENIGFIWKHMSFTQKLTARNILRYKKRFFMTVVGIAGCTALMLTGFGMKDSIGGIVPNQFGRLFLYDAQIGFAHKIDLDNQSVAQKKALTAIENDDRISDAMLFHQQNVKAFTGEKSDILDAYIMVPQEIDRAKDFITFQERKSKVQLEFPNEGAIVNEKLATALSLKVGDEFTIEDSDKKQNKIKITGICENYVSNYVYMSSSQYQKLYDGKTVKYQAMLINITDEAKANETALSADLLDYKEIGGVFFSSTLMKNFTDVFDRLDLVVIVLIVSASLLAFVVLYNLTNINVEERVREIATIKVLGFYNMEVDSYIYRENVVLTFIGILCGFGAGVFLHQFVMRSAEVNLVMFGRDIFPLSYLWAALLTILFALAVNLVMHGRFKKIDMVESLKSIE